MKRTRTWKNKKQAGRHTGVAMAAVAACAVMVATGAADASQLPSYIAGTRAVIEMAQAETSRPKPPSQIVQDDDPLQKVESVKILRSRLPPRIVSAITSARRLDKQRALDWRLRELFHARTVGVADIFNLRRCITADAFTRVVRGWRPEARSRLCEIDGIRLFVDGRPTLEFEELWEIWTRRRIHREDALQRVLDGKIVPAPRRETIAAIKKTPQQVAQAA